QLCLAHYCDTHGPTPLMVTEGLSVECAACDDDLVTRQSTPGSRSRKASEDLSPTKSTNRTSSLSSDKENGAEVQRGQSVRSQPGNTSTGTPPSSPRVKALQSAQNANNRRDSSFRKTYDENDKKKFIPCENCALTLPKKTKEDSETQNKVDMSSPILRTRKPFELVEHRVSHDEPSPPNTNSSDSDTALPQPRRHSRTSSRHVRKSSFTSRMSHTHYLDYTSTHEPLLPSSFSIIRQSCLRTLSCETLPPSSMTPSPSTPTSPYLPSSANPATSTSSGGPIFFGDPLAGYTTAFIFRIPDPNARGRRRVYALMALSPHGEWAAMQAFSFLSVAFRELASWIQRLAEDELERSSRSSPASKDRDADRDGGTGSRGSNSTPTSSFLMGGRGGRERYAGMSLKARGLAELVGMPDFFIELHARFVRLLIELGVVVGS
ncbi:vesicle coat protein, partial [Bisporella sp. PMI_857]